MSEEERMLVAMTDPNDTIPIQVVGISVYRRVLLDLVRGLVANIVLDCFSPELQ
jgi:hypothetical protein